MTEPIVIRFVGAPVYEGKPGWPAKDLSQEELDKRNLSKSVLLAYLPKLYEAVEPEVEEAKPARKRRKRGKKSDLGNPEALILNGERQEEIERSDLGDPKALVLPVRGMIEKPELAGSKT